MSKIHFDVDESLQKKEKTGLVIIFFFFFAEMKFLEGISELNVLHYFLVKSKFSRESPGQQHF